MRIILNLINNILYVIIAYLVFNEKTFHVYAEQLLFFLAILNMKLILIILIYFSTL